MLTERCLESYNKR